jgi:ribonuclease III
MRRAAKSSRAEGNSAQRPDQRAGKVPTRRRKSQRATTTESVLQATIGYQFSDDALLDNALTHVSAIVGGNRAGSYQRLEFLGDHVLGLVISDMLFRAFPKADEGELSRRLADLVRRETCAEVARGIDLGTALKLGASEANAGGRVRVAILADVFESLIVSVFL